MNCNHAIAVHETRPRKRSHTKSGEMKNKETRNSKVLRSFVKFAEKHPELRFWQCLDTWLWFDGRGKDNGKYLFVHLEGKKGKLVDPYFFTGKNQ